MATQLLLADDSPTIGKILQMALQSEPYEIRSVLTAEEALKELRASPPTFFLVDLNLPTTNGYEFARLVKQDSRLKRVRVVLLASAFEPVDESEYASCGADGLVKKPFDPSELRAALRSLQDAPPKFPAGSKVSGSLSGFVVSADEEPTPKGEASDTLSRILTEASPAPSELDADSILAELLESPPPAPGASAGHGAFPPVEPPEKGEFTYATVLLEVPTPSGGTPGQDAALDLTGAFITPPKGTTSLPLPDPQAFPLSPPAPEPPQVGEPLSANAQALSAFFEAEIETKKSLPLRDRAPPPPAPSVAPPPDAFDASLSSIDWTSGPEGPALDEWSSVPPKAPAGGGGVPPPFPRKTDGSAVPASPPGHVLFDTGGSSFRFSEDYVRRITKSFTGQDHEPAPATTAPPHLFPKHSDDRPTSPPPPLQHGGGAWSDSDVQKIEKIVREEVQMVVREVAEKVAWEVIPELAENLIRRELDKVLKEMGS